MTLALETPDLMTQVGHAITAHDTGDTTTYRTALARMHDTGWGTYADMVTALLTGDEQPDGPNRYLGDDAGPVTVTATDLCTFHGEPPF
ncbi:hypothetical protein GCM10009827_115210 [Dactylosporangium maewongense]|uniref:Uncharacterized protein n=1 Tax=Dactylosporangium maewongense TaxID=634393 RepID=A0ABN3K835_9ACTN